MMTRGTDQGVLNRHERSFLTLLETASDRRWDASYFKTHAFDGEFIDTRHEVLAAKLHESGMVDLGVEGWLLPADAYKLYEMAYFCRGNILELGTYRGLSSSLMSEACALAGRINEIISVDLDPDAIEIARENLRHRPGADRVHLFAMDGESAIKGQANAKRLYDFAFIDHSHAYDHVYAAARILHRVVAIGGFAMFHDFNDPRNASAMAPLYGVYQGVMDGLSDKHWEFWGIYGCSGLFRRVGAW